MAGTPALLFNESPAPSLPAPPVDRSRRYTRILLILFLCTLPLVNPIVHGDGVGYYAYIRAPLIEHGQAEVTVPLKSPMPILPQGRGPVG